MRWARPLLDYQACPPFQFRGGHHYSRISRSLSSGAHSRDPVAHAGYLLTWVADRPLPKSAARSGPSQTRRPGRAAIRRCQWNFGTRCGTRKRRDRALGLHIEIKIDGTIQKKRGHLPKGGLISCFFFPAGRHFFDGEEEMTDQQLALQAINEAQLILEEYLRPRPQNDEYILDKLVEVLERPDLVVAVSRLQQQSNLSVRK